MPSTDCASASPSVFLHARDVRAQGTNPSSPPLAGGRQGPGPRSWSLGPLGSVAWPTEAKLEAVELGLLPMCPLLRFSVSPS